MFQPISRLRAIVKLPFQCRKLFHFCQSLPRKCKVSNQLLFLVFYLAQILHSNVAVLTKGEDSRVRKVNIFDSFKQNSCIYSCILIFSVAFPFPLLRRCKDMGTPNSSIASFLYHCKYRLISSRWPLDLYANM